MDHQPPEVGAEFELLVDGKYQELVDLCLRKEFTSQDPALSYAFHLIALNLLDQNEQARLVWRRFKQQNHRNEAVKTIWTICCMFIQQKYGEFFKALLGTALPAPFPDIFAVWRSAALDQFVSMIECTFSTITEAQFCAFVGEQADATAALVTGRGWTIDSTKHIYCIPQTIRDKAKLARSKMTVDDETLFHSLTAMLSTSQ
ncbi:hypothetical protein BLNAU_6306 [Blattamonas nauphoetae]|uniref:CSN8/PSMD8/EIF3K domain-containing protein n=1 Tax=Blattamonas nauphoetae TaxID=2049346 RepID=A0ABQ9Y4Y3_9EUKA|nr:hypothetical protein BLNAU_6306 [Blattamonas nauphoetae]